MKYNRTTKILHLLIVMTVCAQLLSQFWMFVPDPDKLPATSMAAWLFVCHLIVGVIALCFIAVRLLCVMDHEEEVQRLFPWLATRSFLLMWSEMKTMPQWLKDGPPSPKLHSMVASAVHGLGLLLVLAMGLTGIMFYMGLEPDGSMDVSTQWFRHTHDNLGVILWVYLLGHVAMFITHLLFKQSSVAEIFSLRKDEDVTPSNQPNQRNDP